MPLSHVIVTALLSWAGVQPTLMPFTTLARGDQSQVDQHRTLVARTPAEWAALWKEHGGGRTPPAVDLKRSMVVAVFLGTRPTAGHAVEITRIERRDAELVVIFREGGPAPGDIVAQVLTAPFHIVRTESFAGPVKFQRAAR